MELSMTDTFTTFMTFINKQIEDNNVDFIEKKYIPQFLTQWYPKELESIPKINKTDEEYQLEEGETWLSDTDNELQQENTESNNEYNNFSNLIHCLIYSENIELLSFFCEKNIKCNIYYTDLYHILKLNNHKMAQIISNYNDNIIFNYTDGNITSFIINNFDNDNTVLFSTLDEGKCIICHDTELIKAFKICSKDNQHYYCSDCIQYVYDKSGNTCILCKENTGINYYRKVK